MTAPPTAPNRAPRTPAAPPADVISHRYAARTDGGQKVGHLLTRHWPDDPRGLRPALCGLRRQQWRAVHLFTTAADFRDCQKCSAAAGLVQRDPVPLRTEPAPRRRPAHLHDVETVRAELVEPQHARVRVPHGYFDRLTRRYEPDPPHRPLDHFGVPISPQALEYTPQPYDQRHPEQQP